MAKTTAHLLSEIKEVESIDSYFKDNTVELNPRLFVETLNEFLAVKGFSKQALINKSYLNTSYVYDIFNSKKTPSRDTVVRISLALGLDLRDTNRLLQLSGHSDLYPRIEREAVFIFCITRNRNLDYANELLFDMGEPLLFDEKPRNG